LPRAAARANLIRLSIALRTKRHLALLVACALIACAAVYSMHGLADRSHAHSHCDLCLHLSGSSGARAPAAVVIKVPLLVDAIPLPPQPLRPTRSPVGIHLPRGPPPALALI
jgi:hypothetical protein